MPSWSTTKKLKSILVIDLVVLSVVAGGYIFVQSLPKQPISPTDIQLSDLYLNQTDLFSGQSIGVSVNVTNLGEDAGYYTANLVVDGVIVQNESVLLSSGQTKQLYFVEPADVEGVHDISVGRAVGTFNTQNPLALSDAAVNRTLAGIGEPIGISIMTTNRLDEGGNFSLTLKINGTAVQTRAVYLAGGAEATVVFGVVEAAEGTYFFEVGSLNGTFSVGTTVQPPKPAQFVLSGLTIDPGVADRGKPVNVSVVVENVGEATGAQSLSLTVNGSAQQTKEVQLPGGAKTTVLFTVTENATGTYALGIGNSTGTLTVQEPSTISMYGLQCVPYEVSPGDTVNISYSAYNYGKDRSVFVIKLTIDGTVAASRTLDLAGGTDGNGYFQVTAPALTGSSDKELHDVSAGGLTTQYLVVKKGYHTLIVQFIPTAEVEFTIDDQKVISNYSTSLLPEGTHVISLPRTDPTGKAVFQLWEDGSTNPVRTIVLTNRTRLIAVYSGGASCPSLYMWNGTENLYVSEISNHGWLGYINYINEDGTMVFFRDNPWDYIPLDRNQLQPSNGFFDLTLVQRWNEIFYLDEAYMVVVDHPANVNVYSTMVEQYLDPAYMGKIYSVSQSPLTPVSAVNEKGQDVLPLISKADGIFTPGISGLNSQSWDNISWNRLTLDLGNLSGAPQIKLVIRSIVDWGPPEDYVNWLGLFLAQPVPNGTQVTPPPYMEVKDASGNWVRVQDSRQVPLPPDGLARTFVVDLTGLFPTNDYSLRISNFWNVTFDYIGIDTSPQQNLTIQKVYPQAYLYQEFTSGASSSGNFTRYGDVTPLVLAEDDMFVIGRQGDAVSLRFNTTVMGKPADGMVRDYFFFVSCWFKDENGNWGFGFGFTVDPLPFHNMSGFPYPTDESYPYDLAHLAYLEEYNTRVIAP